MIAFSNREIYKNHLITFPNPAIHTPNMGVEYIYVKDGCYEGGGKNCNIREAETCVSLVEEHSLNAENRIVECSTMSHLKVGILLAFPLGEGGPLAVDEVV